jgi:DNA/RNA endonuclease YhcR with UshA esterase domain
MRIIFERKIAVFGKAVAGMLEEIREKIGKVLFYTAYNYASIKGEMIKTTGISNQIYDLKQIVLEQQKQIAELKELIQKR